MDKKLSGMKVAASGGTAVAVGVSPVVWPGT